MTINSPAAAYERQQGSKDNVQGQLDPAGGSTFLANAGSIPAGRAIF